MTGNRLYFWLGLIAGYVCPALLVWTGVELLSVMLETDIGPLETSGTALILLPIALISACTGWLLSHLLRNVATNHPLKWLWLSFLVVQISAALPFYAVATIESAPNHLWEDLVSIVPSLADHHVPFACNLWFLFVWICSVQKVVARYAPTVASVARSG